MGKDTIFGWYARDMLSNVYLTGSVFEYVTRSVKNDVSIYAENCIYDNFLRLENYIATLELNNDITALFNQNKEYLEKYDKEDSKAKLEEPYRRYFLANMERIDQLMRGALDDKLVFQSVKECALDKDCLIKLSKKEKTILFDNELWDKLTDVAISDYSDAAKCILMGASTPAAMITLRAAEEAVRMYYRKKTSNEPGKKAWGTLIVARALVCP